MGIGTIGKPNEPNDPFCGHLCLNGVMNPLTLACGSLTIPHIMRIPFLGILFEKDFEDSLKVLYKESLLNRVHGMMHN